MKKRRIWPIWLMAAAVALSAAEPSVRAAENTDGVRADRSAVVVSEQARTFRLDYRVWSEESVNRRARPCDVLLLLDVSASMEDKAEGGAGLSRLEYMRDGVGGFLEELLQTSPDSRAGLLLFGEKTTAVEPVLLDGAGTATLQKALAGAKAEPCETPDYAGALEQAAKLRESLGNSGRPLFLITVASGNWAGDTDKALPNLQALRDLGAQSYTALLCQSPEEETEEFWLEMSSAPLPTHHYLCAGEAEGCLKQIRRDISSLFSVETVQRLDPRFDLDKSEQERLLGEGAHLEQAQNGAWTVSWEVDLPRREESPWQASLTVRARRAFPGGNDVPLDGEGTGVYRAGAAVADFLPVSVNVPMSFSLKNLDTEIFLGEKIKTATKDKTLEEAMLTLPEMSWFGKGQTGRLSYFWETEAGESVGSLEQLGTLRPKKETAYRLRASYAPASPGLFSVGKPVQPVEKTALCRVRVTPGTLQIKAAPEEGVKLSGDSSLLFRLEKDSGEVYYRKAVSEGDPQSGKRFLAAEFSGLPYGTYTVSPVSQNGLTCREAFLTCRLGVWEKDDTVSPRRNRAQLRFTLCNAGEGDFFA